MTTWLQTLDCRGIDVFARADDQTWSNIEAVQSRGQGYDNSTSLKGGHEMDATTPAGGSSDYALAIDITAPMDLAHVVANGTASAYYQTRDQGFVSELVNAHMALRPIWSQIMQQLCAFPVIILTTRRV